ncbi:hypothetical protein C8J57DRAFT_1518404 [Mycena rebaudengoi]|nr:hypothetical protein C8J57DRAFT_1518404 [Mycena rebaudengoi]
MLPYCPPYRLALRSTSLGGSRRAPLARHQLDELSLWVVTRALLPRGGAQRDHRSRVPQPAAGGRAEEPKALPLTLRNEFSRSDEFDADSLRANPDACRVHCRLCIYLVLPPSPPPPKRFTDPISNYCTIDSSYCVTTLPPTLTVESASRSEVLVLRYVLLSSNTAVSTAQDESAELQRALRSHGRALEARFCTPTTARTRYSTAQRPPTPTAHRPTYPTRAVPLGPERDLVKGGRDLRDFPPIPPHASPDSKPTLQRQLAPPSTSTTAYVYRYRRYEQARADAPPPTHAPELPAATRPLPSAQACARISGCITDTAAPCAYSRKVNDSSSSCAACPLRAAHAPQDQKYVHTARRAAHDALFHCCAAASSLLQNYVTALCAADIALRTELLALNSALRSSKTAFVTTQDDPPNLRCALAREEGNEI